MNRLTWCVGPLLLTLALSACTEKKLGNPSSFPTGEIVSGGVAKDGIPALTSPVRVQASSANFMSPSSLVAGVVRNGTAVAFPIMVMDQHEIANDLVGGEFVAVTYCPLTATAIGYAGGRSGEVVEFGVSGLLFRNNLMIYDRSADEQLWSQMWGSGVSTEWAGTRLPRSPVFMMNWALWSSLHPATAVVDPTQISQNRNYGDGIAYPGYDNSSNTLFPITNTDGRRPAKELVVGILSGSRAVAYPIGPRGTSVTSELLDGEPVVGVFVSSSRFGAMYSAVVGTDTLNFVAGNLSDPNAFLTDTDTGSEWDLTGKATSGTLSGAQLNLRSEYTAYWFAWADFYPGTEIALP
jgi:hypothetical protein